jgi:hypothetical protein
MQQRESVWLYVSDIASYIGQNKWDSVTPFERLWKKCDKSYNEIVETAKKDVSDDVLENIQISEMTKRQHVQKYINKDVLDACLKEKSSTEVKKKTIQKLIDNLDCSSDIRNQLTQSTCSIVNTDHGIAKEKETLDIIEKRSNVVLDTSQKLYKKSLDLDDSRYQWTICGRLDGVYNDPITPRKSYIVEVKNRIKGFFTTVRDYENTQMQLYMWMLDGNGGDNLGYDYTMLEENYKGRVKTTRVNKDNDTIENILSLLKTFVRNFENVFLNDYEAKLRYIAMNQAEKKMYISMLLE